MKLKICKFCLLVVAIGGLVAAADGITRPSAAIRRKKGLGKMILDTNRAGPRAYEGNRRYGSELQATEMQIQRLTDEGRSRALIGLLVAGFGLVGLWLCTDREIKQMKGAQQASHATSEPAPDADSSAREG
jgi:hypothetical protein